MQLGNDKKIYFLSDFHLGAPNHAQSLAREKKIIHFLESISADAAAIFIVGDLFDFWFEYKKVVPKGYVRLFGKLAEITDSGTPVYFFSGNHDMWMKNYFKEEMNIDVYHEPQTFTWNGKRFFIAHGDGLGPGDHGYKFIRSLFRNKFCQWLFGLLHPTLGIGLAEYFSRKSREKTGDKDARFLGEDGEWLIIFSRQKLAKEHFDFFIFGHRHYPMQYNLGNNSYYINLGDWINNNTYAVFDGNTTTLKKWEE